jgi:hypothetical protein
MKRLTPIELDEPLIAERPAEQETSCRGPAVEVLIAELRDHISVLERRLDATDTERHELLKVAAAERKRLIGLLLKRKPKSTWPGIWPMLQRLQWRLS